MGENLEAQAPSLPARVVGLADARRTFGRSVDRLMPALHRSDPLADDAVRVLAEQQQSVHATLDRALSGDRAVPDAVRRLIDAAAELPVWADEHRLDRAGELLFRASVPGGIALGAKSLLSGYCSPAGNKPLIWSGQLMRGISRRLGETAKFVCAVAAPGGLNPGAEGFQITLRVRLIHAQVRRLIEAQGGWRADLWGLPINQHDMAATILLFGNAWLDGIEALGISVTAEEAEDYVHLWRVAGHIIGVEHDLLPATRSEGDRLAKIIQATEGEPDDDARRLVKAFLTHP
ncbi:MAG: oxygenase MpaB family protein, partial [Myxococcota bacterium]